VDGKTILIGALGVGAVGFIAYRLSRPGQTTVVQGGGGGPAPQEMAHLAQQAQAPALQAVSSLQEGILGLAKQYQQESASTKDMIAKMQQQTAQMITSQTQTFGQALEKIATMQTSLGDKMAQQIASVISSQQQFQQQLVSQIQQSTTTSRNTLDSVLAGFEQIIGAVTAKQTTTLPATTQQTPRQLATTPLTTRQPATTQPTTNIDDANFMAHIAPGASADYWGGTVYKALSSDSNTAVYSVGGQNYVLNKATGEVTLNGQRVAYVKPDEEDMQIVYDTSGKQIGALNTTYNTFIPR
jgi:hypothetical protein